MPLTSNVTKLATDKHYAGLVGGIGKAATLSVSHAEAKVRIEAAARRAVERIAEFGPWKIRGEVELKFEYYPESPGTPAAVLSRENKQVSPRTVVYRGGTVLEAFEQWLGK